MHPGLRALKPSPGLYQLALAADAKSHICLPTVPCQPVAAGIKHKPVVQEGMRMNSTGWA